MTGSEHELKTVTLQPGQHLDIEVAGLGILYSVLTYEGGEADVDIRVIDRSNELTIDVNTHTLEGATLRCGTYEHNWPADLVLPDARCETCGLRYTEWME